MTSYVGCYVYTISDVQNIIWQSYTNHHQIKSKCVSSTAIRPERPRNNMKPYLVHRRFVPNRKTSCQKLLRFNYSVERILYNTM